MSSDNQYKKEYALAHSRVDNNKKVKEQFKCQKTPLLTFE